MDPYTQVAYELKDATRSRAELVAMLDLTPEVVDAAIERFTNMDCLNAFPKGGEKHYRWKNDAELPGVNADYPAAATRSARNGSAAAKPQPAVTVEATEKEEPQTNAPSLAPSLPSLTAMVGSYVEYVDAHKVFTSEDIANSALKAFPQLRSHTLKNRVANELTKLKLQGKVSLVGRKGLRNLWRKGSHAPVTQQRSAPAPAVAQSRLDQRLAALMADLEAERDRITNVIEALKIAFPSLNV